MQKRTREKGNESMSKALYITDVIWAITINAMNTNTVQVISSTASYKYCTQPFCLPTTAFAKVNE